MVAIGISVVVLSALFAGCGTQSNNGNDAQTTGKSLVVYFDYAENIDTTGMDADAISSASLSSGKPKGNTENLDQLEF